MNGKRKREKAKYLENKKINKTKGITLIALVLTIIVLLILAGVSIAMLTGDNGLLTRANEAKTETKKAGAEESINILLTEWLSHKYTNSSNLKDFLDSKVTTGELDVVTDNGDGTYTIEKDGYEATINSDGEMIGTVEKTGGVRPQIEINLYQENGSELQEGVSYDTVIMTVNVLNKAEIETIDEIKVTDQDGKVVEKQASTIGTGEQSFKVSGSGIYTITVKATTQGVQKETTIKTTVKVAPEQWKTTAVTDSEWYNYSGAKIEGPNLKGEMTPIKYVGETQEGNKWANAITADGSMWVWIPRYAYKIREGYHSATAGQIDVAFINTSNQFLNGETGTITSNPEEEGAGIDKWLVHPAFTAEAANGGGFGEIKGIWMAKFEATGSYDSTAKTGTLSVKPGVASLRSMVINDQYQLAKTSTFGESVQVNSHMAKNSEWGATVYLGHSKYGTDGQKVEQNTNSSYYTGGSSTKGTIYITNKKQSTTHNATGVYDMNGGAYEYVASYSNFGSSNSYLTGNGGQAVGDLFGATPEEQNTSTAYKTVYINGGSQSANYNASERMKGDAIWETSNGFNAGTGAWFEAYVYFPIISSPFFLRSGNYSNGNAGAFYFGSYNGGADSSYSFRPVLCP